MDADEFRFGLPPMPLGGAQAAAHSWITVAGRGLPGFVIEIRVATSPDGRLICTGLRAGGSPDTVVIAPAGQPYAPPEITVRGLRQIPLPRILAALAARLQRESAASRQTLAEMFGLELAAPALGARRPEVPRGSRLPDEFFETVAAVYRDGLRLNPRNPYKHIMATLHASEPTARRWVMTARRAGALGEAIRGKAGEKPTAAPEDED